MTEAARRHLALFTLAGLMILAPVFWQYFRPVGGMVDVAGFPLGRDFINIWTGARLSTDSVATLFDYGAYYQALQDLFGRDVPFHNWGYPPSLLFFVRPFAWLPYGFALIAWTGLGLAIYLAVALRPLARAGRMVALALLLLAPATLVNILTGQNGFYTAALLLGGMLALERRPVLAGVLFGLLSMKPHLGLLLPLALLVIGAWRTIAAAVITVTLLLIASVAQWGTDPWIGWLSRSGAMARYYLVTFDGFYTYMMPSVYGSARLLGLSLGWASAVQVVASLTVIGATALVFGRTDDARLRALLITSGTLLVSPYTFNYDLTALTAALLWVIAAEPSLDAGERSLFGLAWLVPVLVWPLHLQRIGITPLVLAGVYIMAVIWTVRGARAAATRGEPTGQPAPALSH